MNQSKKMVLTAYEALDEKKGEEIRIIGIGEISILADYFIIAGGASKPQLQAMINNVQEKCMRQALTSSGSRETATAAGS